jgi:hypothetical protein
MVGTGGCGHSSAAVPIHTASPSPVPSGSPTPTPSPTPTANYYVSLAYSSIAPTIDPVYGRVDGYSGISPPPSPVSSPTPTPSAFPSPSPTPTETPGPSSIVSVPCNVNVQFLNFDQSIPHSASLLQTVNGGFPPAFNNVNGTTVSPLLSPISFPGFSTGLVGEDADGIPGRSAVYETGAQAGVYYFGDYSDYNANPSMRTVILVNC